MIDLPPGDSPDDLIVSIADLCRLVGVTPTYFYRQARQGKAPKSRCGITLAEARTWINARRVKKAAKAAAVQRLRKFLADEEAGAAEAEK